MPFITRVSVLLPHSVVCETHTRNTDTSVTARREPLQTVYLRNANKRRRTYRINSAQPQTNPSRTLFSEKLLCPHPQLGFVHSDGGCRVRTTKEGLFQLELLWLETPQIRDKMIAFFDIRLLVRDTSTLYKNNNPQTTTTISWWCFEPSQPQRSTSGLKQTNTKQNAT